MAAKEPSSPTAPTKPKDLVLVAVSGDAEAGEETPILADKPLLVGRSAKGLQLTDPLVSIQHAEIRNEPRRGWVVEDLKSATGTWVDEECVKGESRPIGVGTRLRFGDTVFEVQSANRTPWWMRYVAAGVALLALVALGVFLAQGVAAPPAPMLACAQKGVVLGNTVPALGVPPDFLRTRGLAVWDLRCRAVTDHDFDGHDEVWLSMGEAGDAVITFDDELAWTVLGEFPRGCNEHRATEGGPDAFPELDCSGERWLMVDGRYQVVSHDGPVVWYRELPAREPEPEPAPHGKAKSTKPTKAAKGGKAAPQPQPSKVVQTELPGLPAGTEDVPLQVGRFALKSNELLGAFLAVRGVTEPVHYVICEEAFDGIRAQALTERGQVVDLGVGCISDLRLEGGDLHAKPVAVALTPSGRRALVDDVIRFYAGSTDGLFLDPAWSDLVQRLKADPGYLKGATKLIGDSKESDAARLDPMPDPNQPVRGSHALLNRDSRLEAAPSATTAIVTDQGRSALDPPGCAQLVVETSDFRSYGFYSLVPTTFMTVYETGCTQNPRRLIRARYLGGTWDTQLPGLDLRLVTEGGPSTRGLEIRRARITWRERPEGT